MLYLLSSDSLVPCCGETECCNDEPRMNRGLLDDASAWMTCSSSDRGQDGSCANQVGIQDAQCRREEGTGKLKCCWLHGFGVCSDEGSFEIKIARAPVRDCATSSLFFCLTIHHSTSFLPSFIQHALRQLHMWSHCLTSWLWLIQGCSFRCPPQARFRRSTLFSLVHHYGRG